MPFSNEKESKYFSSIVVLNVGGEMFTTGVRTLIKDSGSKLHDMFGRFDYIKTPALEDGSYFIDRNGACFRYILNYLRTGKLMLPDDKLIQKEVLEEATFYQIQGIVDELTRPKPYIVLNVGGQMFTTSLQTLTKDAGSMLHAMFSGRFDTKPSEDGSYFIDRDGACFRYILNYLRTGKLNLPYDGPIQKEVLEEAMFYQIQGIVDELTVLSGPKPYMYNDSTILSSAQRVLLQALHGEDQKFTKSTLLYRGSSDGWSSSTFHSKCDSFKGPTMVVVKSKGGYIFGGYTNQSWAGVTQFKQDNTAFLFSLVNPAKLTPIVQMKAFQNHGKAIYCNNSFGPVFGVNHDLFICNNPQTSNNCYSNIGNTYKLPTGQSATTFLTGGQYFSVAEMEVFGLQK